MILIQGGRLIDPANRRDGIFDLLISKNKIAKIAKKIPPPKNAKIISAKNCWVLPGLIDAHVHLREPGNEDAETIESGTSAAAAGGVTSLLVMANTQPPVDSVAQLRLLTRRIKEKALISVYPVGAITKNLQGQELTDISAMSREGCVAFSDDGHCLMDSLLLRRALEYCKTSATPVIEHCEDENLSRGGMMHEGALSHKLGLKGIPSQSESVIVARNVQLAELTNSPLHCAHISTEASVNLVREAKRKKIPVSAETCPHYFSLTEDSVERYNTSAKVKPPLRTKRDVAAIQRGLADGTIDLIASDHAPHTQLQKEKEFSQAPFGIIGLETLFSLVYTELIATKILSPREAVRKVTVNPAKIFHLPAGSVSLGATADIALFDPRILWKVTPSDFFSKSSNSPFIGKKLKGKILMTILKGKIVYSDGQIVRHSK